MATIGRKLIRRLPQLPRIYNLSASYNSTAATSNANQYFRTNEENPVNHTTEMSGLYYTLPPDDCTIFEYVGCRGLPKQFMEQCETLRETSFMIRKPAMEVINFLKATNFDNPPIKFVLYGKPGVGKSIVLAHILHYAYRSKFLLFHVPWVGEWVRRPVRYEVVTCERRPGFVDMPESAVRWLQHFKKQNSILMKELDLRIANEYEWSKREISKPGDPFIDIVDLGITRTRHACEVIIAVVNEIKGFSIANKCKTLVAIDGFNGFFFPETNIKNEERKKFPPEKVSFIPAVMSLVAPDWHNGAAVLICDELAVPGHDASTLPIYQLTKTGFHHLYPFIPIEVPEMSEAEIRNNLAYFKERKWLHFMDGDDELLFLCGGNPYKLMRLCNPL